MNENMVGRLAAKTPEQRFLNTLEQDFQYAPRVAQAILLEAKSCLLGEEARLRPGQRRVLLAKRGARYGQTLQETEKVEVTWTIDAGVEDLQVAQQEGAAALRRVRIARLLDEALAQGGVATQEDLAWALNVNPRTIRRDCAKMRAAGQVVPTRGHVQGTGRGQTHKREIVARWLAGETYDQITFHARHSDTSVGRYIQGFLRVVHLLKEGFSVSESALLLQMSRPLVAEYRAIYAAHDGAEARRRINEQLRRVGKGLPRAKKGAR